MPGLFFFFFRYKITEDFCFDIKNFGLFDKQTMRSKRKYLNEKLNNSLHINKKFRLTLKSIRISKAIYKFSKPISKKYIPRNFFIKFCIKIH